MHAKNPLQSPVMAAVYLAALLGYASFQMVPSLFRSWYFSSDEYVYAAEVIRFLHFDFRQHFFDQPGTPYMLLATVFWAVFYTAQRVLLLIPSSVGMEQFTFDHLPALFTLMRGMTLAFFLISLVLAFRVAGKLTNRAGACAASMLLMMSPTYTSYSSFVRTESMTMCLILAAILVLLSSFEAAEGGPPKRRRLFVVGILIGVAAGARLHSLAASLPVLMLLLWTAPASVMEEADHLSARRFCLPALAGISALSLGTLTLVSSDAFTRTEVGRAFSGALPFILKFVIAAVAGAAAAWIAFLVPTTKSLVIRIMNPSSFIVVAGCVLGFLVATPTVLTQYGRFIQSAAMYNGDYKDWEHMGMPLLDHLVWYVKYYVQAIAPDPVALLLMVLGGGGILLFGNGRLLAMLTAGLLFFVSKPLDLLVAAHHVILWLPLFAVVLSYPIAGIFEVITNRWPHAHQWSSISAFFLLAGLFLGLTSGPRKVRADTRSNEERMESIRQATDWIKTSTEPDVTVAIAYFCFNSDVFYTWLDMLDVPVPSSVHDGRQYLIWWGHNSALKGRQGYAMVTQADRHSMKESLDLASRGEGTDPYEDKRFGLVRSFGTGQSQVDILAFDFRDESASEAEWLVTASGWPNTVRFVGGRRSGETYALSGQGSQVLFHQEMDTQEGWQINRYGQLGGLEILPDGLSPGDRSARYSSGNARDHLSSPYMTLEADTELVFFSVWAKPPSPAETPQVGLQDASYSYLAHARRVIARSDGWILLAGWVEISKPQEVRMIVNPSGRAASLLDKALVVSSAKQSIHRVASRHSKSSALSRTSLGWNLRDSTWMNQFRHPFVQIAPLVAIRISRGI